LFTKAQREEAASKNSETRIQRRGAEYVGFRHSRMLLAGIQARPELDPRRKHSGMTPLGLAALCSDTRQLAVGNLFPSVSSAFPR
jgi:hypothetical protein